MAIFGAWEDQRNRLANRGKTCCASCSPTMSGPSWTAPRSQRRLRRVHGQGLNSSLLRGNRIATKRNDLLAIGEIGVNCGIDDAKVIGCIAAHIDGASIAPLRVLRRLLALVGAAICGGDGFPELAVLSPSEPGVTECDGTVNNRHWQRGLCGVLPMRRAGGDHPAARDILQQHLVPLLHAAQREQVAPSLHALGDLLHQLNKLSRQGNPFLSSR